MMVRRKQFPVGQGGLHAEHVEFNCGSVAMVYDCGSVSKSPAKKGKRPIEREIDQLECFLEKKEVDYLILSHLHEDHINGVEYLKKQGWKVRHLVLPYTTPQEKILYAAALISNGAANGLVDFVLNPRGYFDEADLIEVNHDTEIDGRDDENLPILNGHSPLANGGYVTVANHCGWGLALFNYRNKDISDWIAKQNLPTDVENWSKLSKQKAVEVYKNACKEFRLSNFNLTSLCAFSGSLLGCDCRTWTHRFCCDSMRSDRHGWIHTGDILLKGDCLQEFSTFFSSYFNRTGVIQVPHHGSKNGYDAILNSQSHTASVVCVGEKNHYHHPNVDVLHKVLQQKGQLAFVTDNTGTTYEDVLKCVC